MGKVSTTPRDDSPGFWESLKDAIKYKEIDLEKEAREIITNYVEILQEKVPWKEKILLPLTDELYIVEKGEERLIKCSCGYEFGDYRENWKLKALIHVRDSEEEINGIISFYLP